ncbi:hypothetical protein BS78_K173800 [Paspalum vaginatum]|uniref:Peptidase A1 domain-containing protein n=1 Tax=Paspalum vaginatum TaxID=158149 RepID=A0A9W7X7H0_9POAL|nr:hypothetical protein BS78_K243500 [Paspalum vaginatum]KAJ1255684.1 hypothetical protein BS78_K173800 [Paspalum vaginatum]
MKPWTCGVAILTALLMHHLSLAIADHTTRGFNTSSKAGVYVGTGNGRGQFLLKVDATSIMMWLQCEPCRPQAQQGRPLFVPRDSPSFVAVHGASGGCDRRFFTPLPNNLCAFHYTGNGNRDGVDLGVIFIGCAHNSVIFRNDGIYAGVVGLGRVPQPSPVSSQPHVLGMSHGHTSFSYCLSGETNRQGLLRFGTDVPVLHTSRYRTTRIRPALHAQDGAYHVSLVGVSLGAHILDAVRPEMFGRRGEDVGEGGCIIDIGTPLTVMAQEAYSVVEEAVWSELQRHGAERVEQHDYGLCVRATEATKRRLPSMSLHFAEEEATLVVSPKHLFLIMDDMYKKAGQIACLAMRPGRRTVIGALQQVDTRFVFDLEGDRISFAPESCTKETTLVV